MTMYRYDQTNDTLVQIESEDELLLPARPESRVTVVPYSQPLEAPVLPRTNVVYTDLIKPLQQARPTHEDHDGLSKGIHRLAVLSSLLLFPTSFGLAGSLSGSILVETVFNWQGMGRLYYDTLAGTPDENVIVALTFVFTLMYVGIRILLEVLYIFLDPRVRYSE